MLLLVLITSCLQYSNSAINPILYAFLSDHFKKSFRDTCAWWTRGSRGQSTYRHRDLTFTTRRTRRGPRFTAVLQVKLLNNSNLKLFNKFNPITSLNFISSRMTQVPGLVLTNHHTLPMLQT